MSSLDEKIDKLIHDIKSLGPGLPAECQDKVADLNQAARDLRQAQLNRDSAIKNIAGGSVTYGGGAVTLFLCVAGGAVTGGAALALCLVGGGTGAVGGALWADGGQDSLEAAEEEMEDVIDLMDKLADDLCRCLMQHMNP
jgi:hypothetical protein